MNLDISKVKQYDFARFLAASIIVAASAGVLTAGSGEVVVFLCFYAFSGGLMTVCFAIYFYPTLRALLYPEISTDIDPGLVLLRGVNGERPRAKKRDLEDMLRRTKI
jgi:hypothetical protein